MCYQTYFKEENSIDLKAYYEKLFLAEPELLTVKNVMRLTGYVKASVQRWINTFDLEAFKIKYAYVIPKECLIDFMVSKRFRGIIRKSEVHQQMIANFRKEVLYHDRLY